MDYRNHKLALLGRLLLIFITLGIMFLTPHQASACSCVWPPPDPDVAFVQADAVFVGQATGMLPSLDYGVNVPFSVSESWKGVTKTNVMIHTGLGGGDCGYTFTPGVEYVVYAYGSGGSLETGICNRTSPVSAATADLAYLSTLPSLSLTRTLPWTVYCCGIPLVLFLFVGFGGIWYFKKRKKAN